MFHPLRLLFLLFFPFCFQCGLYDVMRGFRFFSMGSSNRVIFFKSSLCDKNMACCEVIWNKTLSDCLLVTFEASGIIVWKKRRWESQWRKHFQSGPPSLLLWCVMIETTSVKNCFSQFFYESVTTIKTYPDHLIRKNETKLCSLGNLPPRLPSTEQIDRIVVRQTLVISQRLCHSWGLSIEYSL